MNIIDINALTTSCLIYFLDTEEEMSDGVEKRKKERKKNEVLVGDLDSSLMSDYIMRYAMLPFTKRGQ